MNLRRVLILADESANWVVAGLPQLERIALCLDEAASEHVSVTIFWRPDLDRSLHRVPEHPRLTKIRFTTEPEPGGYDLVVSTRLFVYRKVIGELIGAVTEPPIWPAAWDTCFEQAKALPPRPGAWEYIPAHDAIDSTETRFLRGSGKSQDGFVSRFLNRPLSRTITRLLLRSPITPNAWTWLIFPLPVIAALIMARGTYGSFVCALLLFQAFSILDGCDGEIARAKFMESENGRRLDDFFDVLSNILLVLGLGIGLRHVHAPFGGIYFAEGILCALLIAANEWLLARAPTAVAGNDSLGETLYPRHRALVERSGLLAFGEKFASLVMQLTKRDIAVLFFVFLAVIGLPALILHMLFAVSAVSLVLALRARSGL